MPSPTHEVKEDYKELGLHLQLSQESKDHPDVPDWRAGLFSLMFPLPDHTLPSPESQRDEEFEGVKGLYDAQGFLRVPSNWTDGRFQGVREIDLRTGDPGKSYYQKAKHRFGDVLGESVGADAIDNKPSENNETRCVRYDFPQGATNDDSVIIIPPDLSNNHPGQSVRLVSAELLQYGHLQIHDPHGGESHSLITRFLVVHVVAENCSTALLDNLSQALHRPRHTLEPDEDKPSKILHNVMAAVRRRMSFPHHPLTFVMAPGGYLERANDSEEYSQQINLEEHTFHSRLMGDDAYAKRLIKNPTTLRSVCALPGNPDVRAAPEIWRDGSQEKDLTEAAWLRQWGWSLATGADEFWEGIPDDADGAEWTDSFRRFRHWTLCTTESGIAHLRHPHAGTQDTKFWMLSMTRYVDLAVLVQRCFIALSSLSSRLRDIHEDALKNLNVSEKGDRHDGFQILEQELELLGKLQEDFVQFRDRLWFNVVPKHSSDTHILKSLRRASGVDDIYDDLVDEIEIRKEVYNTRSAQHRMRKEHAENKRAQATNLLLSAMAAALAVPGFADISGVDHSWSLLGKTLAVTVVFAVLIWLVVRLFTRDKTSRPSTKKARSR